jgi:hypothetical protein
MGHTYLARTPCLLGLSVILVKTIKRSSGNRTVLFVVLRIGLVCCRSPRRCISGISWALFSPISSASLPIRHMNNSSSMSAVRYAPGTSTIATSLFLNASIVAVIITDSRVTVGDVASDLVDPSLCFLPSAQALPLIDPYLFSFRNMSDSRAPFFCTGERYFTCTGEKVYFMCSWPSSFSTDFSPFSLNFCSPLFR